MVAVLISSDPVVKNRQRANTAGDDHAAPSIAPERSVSQRGLINSVPYLDEITVRRPPVNAALINASLATTISAEVSTKKLHESQQMVDFNTFVRDVQDSIYSDMEHKPSKQYEIAHEVESDVDNAVGAIENRVTEYSSFGTKVAALTALCEIGELMIDPEEEIGKALKMGCDGGYSTLEGSMGSNFRCINQAERERLRGRDGTRLGEKLRARMDGRSEWKMFSGLQDLHTQYFTETANSP